jgi:hypothetical protein
VSAGSRLAPALAIAAVGASLAFANRVLADIAPVPAADAAAPSAAAATGDAGAVSLGAVTVVVPEAGAPTAADSDAGAATAAPTGDAGAPAADADGGAPKKDRYVRMGRSVEDFMERDFTWDANLEGALGPGFAEQGSAKLLGFGRVRVGAMLIAAPHFLMVGATYEFSNRSFATFGLQFEYMHLTSGAWMQVAPLFDAEHPRPGVSLAAGWATFGVELQQRAYEGLGQTTALFGKVRFPVGVFVWALTNKQHAQGPQQGENALPYSPLRF